MPRIIAIKNLLSFLIILEFHIGSAIWILQLWSQIRIQRSEKPVSTNITEIKNVLMLNILKRHSASAILKMLYISLKFDCSTSQPPQFPSINCSFYTNHFIKQRINDITSMSTTSQGHKKFWRLMASMPPKRLTIFFLNIFLLYLPRSVFGFGA